MNNKAKKEVPADPNDPLSKLYSFPADSKLWKELLEASRVYPGAMRAPHYHVDCPNIREGILINQLFLKEFVSGWERKNPHVVCEQDFANGDTKYRGSVDFWLENEGAGREHRDFDVKARENRDEYQQPIDNNYSQPGYQHEEYYEQQPNNNNNNNNNFQQETYASEGVDNLFVDQPNTHHQSDDYGNMSPQGIPSDLFVYSSSRQDSYKTQEGKADLEEKLRRAKARHREMTSGKVSQYSASPNRFSTSPGVLISGSPAGVGSPRSTYYTPGQQGSTSSQYSPTPVPKFSPTPVQQFSPTPYQLGSYTQSHSPGYVTASPRYTSYSPTYATPLSATASYSPVSITPVPVSTSTGDSDLERRVAALERGFKVCEVCNLFIFNLFFSL